MLIAILAAAATAAGSPAEVEGLTADGALAAETAWVRALETRDVAALDHLLAPDFADSDWGGALRSRTAVLAALPTRRATRLELTELGVRLYGEAAVVRGLNTQRAPDGSVVGRVRFTDVFIYRDGRWQAVAAQETLVREPTARP